MADTAQIPVSIQDIQILQKNPEHFFTHVLGVQCEPYQNRILRAIADNDRVAISACHSAGKSWTLARVVLWFMSCFPGCRVITTAPTFNQVQNILWAEIRSGHARSRFPLGGKLNLTEWQMSKSGDWFAIGFTPRNELTNESGQGAQSSFQGFHSKDVLIIFDEATGIPHNIWTMAEGMLTSGNAKMVAIGNPTSRNAEFYKCFHSPEWAKIKLSCFDSPNLIANGILNLNDLEAEIHRVQGMSDTEASARLRSYKEPKTHLLSLKWVVSMGLPRKWGTTHPLFLSKVLGEFPKDADGALIHLGYVEAAQLRVVYPTQSDRKSLGVDVARFGSDATVLTALHGKKQTAVKALIQKDTNEIVGEIIAAQRREPLDVIVVDETGIGGGVVDVLRERQREHDSVLRNTEIRGVQFGAACQGEDHDKYVNLKARMFGLLRDDLKASDGLSLLPEDVYLEELPSILYAYDSRGKMRIESKDEYKKRTGRKSPDYADSLALANYGRYDELSIGSFADDSTGGFGIPFAASLNSGRQW